VNRPILLAAIGIVIVIAAIILNFVLGEPDATVQPQKTDKPQTSGSAAVANKTACVVPSFDVVRINPHGDSVMAGRGTPSGKVRILDDGKLIGEALADDRGEWVFVPTNALPPGSRQLSLEMTATGCDKMISESVVVLVVPEGGKDIAGLPTEGNSQALALKVARDGSTPSKVLQSPSQSGDKFSLTVDVVDYDEIGRLGVSGKAAPEAKIQLYLSNKHMGGAVTMGDGSWNLTTQDTVAPGVYTLRADQIDGTGKVLARVSIPFSKNDFAGDLKEGTFIVVQPGNSLWRLARQTYGTGFNYSVIYEANKGQITDPDLIYPGQIFALPKSMQ
jgi:LysM repeat protein